MWWRVSEFPFLFKAEQHSIVCVDCILFIRSSISGHLSCFPLLAIVSNALDIVVQISAQIPVPVLLGAYSQADAFIFTVLVLLLPLYTDVFVDSAAGEQDEGFPPLPSHPVLGNVHCHCPVCLHRDSRLPAVWKWH